MSRRILVADDSKTVRQLVSMILTRNLGVEVAEAEDGDVALELARKETFDLIVTDINMPRMSGLALVNALRHDLKLDVPIIIVTTVGGDTDRDKGLSLGANAYLPKPFTTSALLEAVGRFLR